MIPSTMRVMGALCVVSASCVPVFRFDDAAADTHDSAVVIEDVIAADASEDALFDSSPDTITDAPVDIVLPDGGTTAARRDLCAGNGFTCAIVAGQVYCWGRNDFGQTGSPTGDMDRCNPREPVPACPVRVVSTLAREASEVVCGEQFACALLANGKVWCWGRNDRNQLGPNATSDTSPPVSVGDWPAARHIVAGAKHACVSLGAIVHCWGDNEFGQLGRASGAPMLDSTPRQVVGLPSNSPVAEIHAGRYHTIVRLADNRLFGWGRNSNGQLSGRPSSTDSTAALIALPNTTLTPVTISAGWTLTCATTNRGTYCGGSNGAGELGFGTAWTDPAANEFDPGRVAGDEAMTILAIGGSMESAAGVRHHVCGVTRSAPRELSCWGNNNSSQLAINRDAGTTITRPAVVAPPFADPIVSLAAGAKHTCARTSSENIYCWGANASLESTGHEMITPVTIVPTPSLVTIP